jgi:hypothetical protein
VSKKGKSGFRVGGENLQGCLLLPLPQICKHGCHQVGGFREHQVTV